MRYIVEKGSVAIDGISLTVTGTDDSGFSVSLIPHTAKMTTLGFKTAGDPVNLETDIIARYVEKMLGLQTSDRSLFDSRRTVITGEDGAAGEELTEEFFRKHGF